MEALGIKSNSSVYKVTDYEVFGDDGCQFISGLKV